MGCAMSSVSPRPIDLLTFNRDEFNRELSEKISTMVTNELNALHVINEIKPLNVPAEMDLNNLNNLNLGNTLLLELLNSEEDNEVDFVGKENIDTNIVKVIDGNTCIAKILYGDKIYQIHIKLLNYDIPKIEPVVEARSSKSLNAERKLAKYVKQQLSTKVCNQIVKLHIVEKISDNNYGCILYLLDNEQSINEFMIESKLGYPDTGKNFEMVLFENYYDDILRTINNNVINAINISDINSDVSSQYSHVI